MAWHGLSNDDLYFSEQTILLYVRVRINKKLWRKIEPPKGWTKRLTKAHSTTQVKFTAPLGVPLPERGWYEEMAMKLRMIEARNE